ncbi:uncharacterized protein LOC128502236 [Spea bombifrons]|uniref:uncharacterized protein LOC128502236 n=1 Tax=Spea bombifrons TaxID=233779 RepID=UPI0023492363|nr:uncharacterized protein LOC128502236 [Spea bombifrons]
MGCNIPPSHVIPAIAARLKYYVEVQRKEAGFDLSVNQRDTIENYKLYQLPKGHGFHQTQRIRKNVLDNQMEAALRLYSEKSNGEWNPNIQVNQERKQDVQRKIKKKMTSLTILDSITSNIVYPRRARYSHSAPSDWEGKSSYLSEISPPDMPHEEFTRLISSAAKLIVATTPGKHERRTIDSNRKLSSLRRKNDQYILPHRQKFRINSSLKAKEDSSRHCVWLKIPSTLQESDSNTNSPNGEPAFTSCEGDADVGVKRNQTSTEADETKVKDVDYEITVRTGSSPPLNTEPELMIILVGKNGRTKKLRLQSSSTNSVPFRTGQVFIFKVKAKDTGTPTHIIIEGKGTGEHIGVGI